jgi:hypothetical protein
MKNFVLRPRSHKYKTVTNTEKRLTVAQAVSRWLPTAAVRVSVLVACGIYGG